MQYFAQRNFPRVRRSWRLAGACAWNAILNPYGSGQLPTIGFICARSLAANESISYLPAGMASIRVPSHKDFNKNLTFRLCHSGVSPPQDTIKALRPSSTTIQIPPQRAWPQLREQCHGAIDSPSRRDTALALTIGYRCHPAHHLNHSLQASQLRSTSTPRPSICALAVQLNPPNLYCSPSVLHHIRSRTHTYSYCFSSSSIPTTLHIRSGTAEIPLQSTKISFFMNVSNAIHRPQ